MSAPLARLRRALEEPWDAAGLAAFRVMLGALLFVSVVRTVANGWVETLYLEPSFHFHYPGFAWVTVPPAPVLYGLFAVLAVAALGIAAGAFYRLASWTFFVGFAYVELLDVTYYLNHYVLVSLLAFLACWLPLHRAYSVDARWRPELARRTLPAWITWLLRFQLGCVYVFAGLAKLQPDWLLHGQPLGIWLASRSDLWLVGPWMDEPGVALAMSWAGFLYDSTIPFWLLWKRSRPYAYAAVLAFHGATAVLFDIGMFPWLMSGLTVIFFSPSWPRRFVGGAAAALPVEPRLPLTHVTLSLLALYAALQVTVPLRSHAYGGDVLWHEQGMRLSWRVMVREKNGSVVYRVRLDGGERERYLRPSRYLTPYQTGELGAQPDLIVQLAHRIADDLEAAGHGDVEVRVDAFASLNGRPRARLIDPEVDLARVPAWPLAPAEWILPAPGGAPLSRARVAAGAAR